MMKIQTQFKRDLDLLVAALDDGANSEEEELDEKGLVRVNRTIPFTIRIPKVAERDFLEYPLDFLGLGIRTIRGCDKLNMRTIGDVLRKWDELTVKNGKTQGIDATTGLGRVSVRELKTKVMEFYYDSLNEQQRLRFWAEAIWGIV